MISLSRSLAIALGGLVGYLIGNKWGDLYLWVFFCVAFAIAAETSIRTIRNVKAPVTYSGFTTKKAQSGEKKYKMQKPPDPHF